MLFSSMTFVFVFMPLVMSIYLLSKKEIRNYVLLAASIIFYAWGEPRYLAIMIMTIFVTYAGARLIDRYVETAGRKWALALTVLVDLGFLIYFKYFNFIVDNVNAALQLNLDFIDVVMPIGISFYTFQAISYLIDVYRREVEAQKDVNKLALYIVLFPQLVAGPIVKYHDVCEQIDERTVTFADVVIGLKRFIIGLSKKVLIANTLAVVVDRILPSSRKRLVSVMPGWELSLMPFSCILTFPVTRTWLSVWGGCLVSVFWKTLIIPIFPSLFPNFGRDGIFHWQPGLSSICIFRSAAIGSVRCEPMSICLSFFWLRAFGTVPAGHS